MWACCKCIEQTACNNSVFLVLWPRVQAFSAERRFFAPSSNDFDLVPAVLPSVTSSLATGVASCGALGHILPSTSNYLFFSVNFRAAQSLTATLCGCLSKQICTLPNFCDTSCCGSSVATTWTLFSCIISRHFLINFIQREVEKEKYKYIQHT